MSKDKEDKKEVKKSLIAKILSYGARDKAEKAPREEFLDRAKIKKFKFNK